mmetsp:Transcript_11102/g.18402  ORF Transcript_11102/g.18402 Transcript_11102/m.18402 type:complete len:477 (-) Transcript_11102:664-2094(-)
MINVRQIDNEKRSFREIDQTIQCWLNKDHLLVRVSRKAQISVGQIEFEAKVVLLGDRVDLFAKVAKGGIQLFAQLPFALLVVHFIGIVHAATACVDCLGGIHDFGKELNVLLTFLSHHNGILEMKMDQDHNFTFTWLKDGVLDVVVHDIHNFRPRRDEAQAIGMRLEVTLGLASRKDGTHGQVGETWDAFVLGAHQLFLFDQIGLLLLPQFTSAGALAEFGNLTKGLCQIVTIETAKGQFSNKGGVGGIFGHQFGSVGGRILADGHAGRVKVDAQVGGIIWIGQNDVLDGGNMEGHGITTNGQNDALVGHVHLDLIGLDVIWIISGATIGFQFFRFVVFTTLAGIFGIGACQFLESFFVATFHHGNLFAFANSRALFHILSRISVLGETRGLTRTILLLIRSFLGEAACHGSVSFGTTVTALGVFGIVVIISIVVIVIIILVVLVVDGIGDIGQLLMEFGHEFATSSLDTDHVSNL